MTAPTEAEIRAFMEACPAETWQISYDEIVNYASDTGNAFSNFVENDRITDDDFGVYHDAHIAEVKRLLPQIDAALRPLMIEAQVRATVLFFERFPRAPLAKDAVPA